MSQFAVDIEDIIEIIKVLRDKPITRLNAHIDENNKNKLIICD